jgi:serine/threonine-protein kinase
VLVSGTPQQIGPYTIDAEIGRGGMGVVYRARDTRLDRAVAIKALPEHLAEDPDRLARFEREAKTLATLNHANIAQIYGVEEHEGRRYLVLELVEGETLAELIGRGPLAIDESIEIATQVAEGVAAAHEAGVVHRDLKPGNIIITPEGRAKVLDFGLARVEDAADPASGSSMSPTMTSPAQHSPTMPGVILGTAAYMSPEQARGRRVDKRSDVWSFGVILYEMLTGASPFAGETVSDSVGAVLHKDLDLDRLPRDTPARVRRVLRRCLTRDRSRRLQSIGDARVELLDIEPEETSAPAAGGRFGWAALAGAAAGAALVVGAIGAWLWAPGGVEAPPAVQRFSIVAVEDGGRIDDRWGAHFAISPDGTRMAIALLDGSDRTLWVRSLDSDRMRRLPGTEGAEHVSFSPDGQWILFANTDSLQRVSVSGGTPIRICATGGDDRGATWLDDGRIVFAPTQTDALMIVDASGGEPEPLTELDASRNERSHRWPSYLREANAVVFTAQRFGTTFNEASIDVLDLTTGERTTLVRGGAYGRILPTGHVVFLREASLYAAPVDLDRMELTGEPVPVIDGITYSASNGGTHLAFSQTGTLLYLPGGERNWSEKSLIAVDMEGAVTQIAEGNADYNSPAVSPDGRRIAFMIGSIGNNADIWLLDLDRGLRTRLTYGEDDETAPMWSPDGSLICYVINRGGLADAVMVVPADGSAEPAPLGFGEVQSSPTDWSPDGRSILVTVGYADEGRDLMIARREGDGWTTAPFVATPFDESFGAFSPDGAWVVYESDASGQHEIYITRSDGSGGRLQLSTSGGQYPRWSPDGTRVYYLREFATDRPAMMAVDLAFEETRVRASRPLELFRTEMSGFFTWHLFDVMPDGSGFVAMKPLQSGEERDLRRLNLVLNWFEELKR